MLVAKQEQMTDNNHNFHKSLARWICFGFLRLCEKNDGIYLT